MNEHTWEELLEAVRAEVEAAAGGVAREEALALAEEVLAARRIFVAGEGRSGLIARGFAMRLAQLGLTVYVAGETTAPAAEAGDLLLAVSRSGRTRVTRARAEAAQQAGVKVALLTAEADALPAETDLVVRIPGGPSEQFGGTLFEQAALLVLDALTRLLQQRLGQSHEDMQARHATLE